MATGRSCPQSAFTGSAQAAPSSPQGAATDDPPGTVRSSHLQMLGPVYLPATGTGRQAARFLSRIDPTPEVHYVPDPRRLTEKEIASMTTARMPAIDGLLGRRRCGPAPQRPRTGQRTQPRRRPKRKG